MAGQEPEDFDAEAVANLVIDPDMFVRAVDHLTDQMENTGEPDSFLAATLAYAETYPEMLEGIEDDPARVRTVRTYMYAVSGRMVALGDLNNKGYLGKWQVDGQFDATHPAMAEAAVTARLSFDADGHPCFNLLDFLGRAEAIQKEMGF